MAIDERLPRLEGIIEAITSRLDSLYSRINNLEARMDARFNNLITIAVAMWVTTMLAVLSTLAAVLLKG
jgi:molecular chaperone GrpE (heat shock protein)